MRGRDDFRAGVERWTMGRWASVQDHHLFQTIWVDDMRDAWAAGREMKMKVASSEVPLTATPSNPNRGSEIRGE